MSIIFIITSNFEEVIYLFIYYNNKIDDSFSILKIILFSLFISSTPSCIHPKLLVQFGKPKFLREYIISFIVLSHN